MKKKVLRSLGIGFLSAAILTGAFAIFVQGHTPVGGVEVNTLFGNDNEEELAEYQQQVSSLLVERDYLESTRNTLNESLASFSEREEEVEEEISSLNSVNSSLQAALDDTGDETSDLTEEDTADDEEETDVETANEEGVFTISSGESSEEIANRLVEEGFLDSAEEFQALLDEWNLHSVIQTGDYELDSQMNIHDIASIITNGAYFYY